MLGCMGGVVVIKSSVKQQQCPLVAVENIGQGCLLLWRGHQSQKGKQRKANGCRRTHFNFPVSSSRRDKGMGKLLACHPYTPYHQNKLSRELAFLAIDPYMQYVTLNANTKESLRATPSV
jgi:hypothetical protein